MENSGPESGGMAEDVRDLRDAVGIEQVEG
jgi:hypothetical protein